MESEREWVSWKEKKKIRVEDMKIMLGGKRWREKERTKRGGERKGETARRREQRDRETIA